MKKVQMQITVVIEPDKDEYHAYCPALKGVHVSGETEDDAFNNAREAAIMYLKSLVAHGDPIPVHGDGKSRDAAKNGRVPPTATRRELQVAWPSTDQPETTGEGGPSTEKR